MLVSGISLSPLSWEKPVRHTGEGTRHRRVGTAENPSSGLGLVNLRCVLPEISRRACSASRTSNTLKLYPTSHHTTQLYGASPQTAVRSICRVMPIWCGGVELSEPWPTKSFVSTIRTPLFLAKPTTLVVRLSKRKLSGDACYCQDLVVQFEVKGTSFVVLLESNMGGCQRLPPSHIVGGDAAKANERKLEPGTRKLRVRRIPLSHHPVVRLDVVVRDRSRGVHVSDGHDSLPAEPEAKKEAGCCVEHTRMVFFLEMYRNKCFFLRLLNYPVLQPQTACV